MATPEMFLKRKAELEEIIDGEHNDHVLDRVDACLELSQLLEKDLYQRAKFVQIARDLLKKV